MSDTPETDAVLNTFDGKASKLAADLATHAERLERERDELRWWKRQSMAVMPPYQKIGDALDLHLGDSIHDKILPGIEKLKRERNELRRDLDKALAEIDHLQGRVDNLTATGINSCHDRCRRLLSVERMSKEHAQLCVAILEQDLRQIRSMVEDGRPNEDILAFLNTPEA